MNYKEFFTEFNKVKRIHQEKFGVPPYFIGYDAVTPENLEEIRKAISTNKPVNQEVPAYLRKIKGLIID